MSLKVNIQKKLGNFQLNVSFETGNGTLGLLGTSGCGKSLTLRCIAGLETPDTGTIELDGISLFDSEKNINLPPQKRHVGYLFQNYALFPNMTVQQNILCGLKHEKNKEKRQQIYSAIVQTLQLSELENQKPDQLSGGQAQRTALARIMVNQPKLLLLDEPFSALDTHLREKLQIELKDFLATVGIDTILVTHSRDEAYHMCKNIAVIDRGCIITQKSTQAIFSDPGSAAAASITGCKNIVSASKVGNYEIEVSDWGIRLQTNTPVKNTLTAVGIRAHCFSPDTAQNRIAVQYLEEIDGPFEKTVLFRTIKQSKDTPPIWWRIPKSIVPDELPSELGIDPENILLLY